MDKFKKAKKITLCRHFLTKKTADWKWMSSLVFNEWVRSNEKDLPINGCDRISINQEWEICLSSDLPRAAKTAEIYAPRIALEYKSDLREVPFMYFHNNIVLPKAVWLFLSRVYWLFGNGNYENKDQTFIRAKKTAKMLDEKSEINILVVSHGFFMNCLVKELTLLGFKGRLPIYPTHGKFYCFEKCLE